MRSSTGIALLVLYGHAFGVRVPVPEVRKIKVTQREAEPELDKRITCIEDDYLLSFQMYIEDSYPSCSAYLSIPETTTFSTATARTTVVVLETTYQTFQQQITEPSTTTTVTTTVPNTLASPALNKRQDSGITPAAVVFAQCAEATGLNASIIHSISSACSCLFITEKVNVVLTTVTSTRIEPGIDHIQTTEVETVTEGERTVHYTVKPSTFGHNPNITISSTGSVPSPTFSTGSLDPNLPSSSLTPSSSGAPIPPTTGVPTAPPASSSIPAPSNNGTLVVPLSSTLSSGLSPSVSNPNSASVKSSSAGPIGNPSISAPPRGETGSSTGLPALTGNVSSILIPFSTFNPSTMSSPDMHPVSSIATPSSSISIANSSIPVGPGTGVLSSLPTVFSTSTLPGSTKTVLSPSTGVPPASGNVTVTSSSTLSSPAIPTGTRGGLSISPSSSVSSIIVLTGNSTLPPSPSGTTGPPATSDCPADNGTIYTTQDQDFLIECFINYGGPVNQGLVERTLNGCIDDCAIANIGFSQSRCYAASYFPNIIGPNCFFKTRESSLTPFDNEMTVSALLLNPSSSNSSTQGSPIPTDAKNVSSTTFLSMIGTSVRIPSGTGRSMTLPSSAATSNSSFAPAPSFSSGTAPGSAPATTNGTTSIRSLSSSSSPASGSLTATTNGTASFTFSSFSGPASESRSWPSSNVTATSYTGTAPLTTGTIPKAPSTQPFSTGTVPTFPAGNYTTGKPTGTNPSTKSHSPPPFSISQPLQNRIDSMSMNGTTATPPATSCPECTSYVYTTSVVFTTSVVLVTSSYPIH